MEKGPPFPLLFAVVLTFARQRVPPRVGVAGGVSEGPTMRASTAPDTAGLSVVPKPPARCSAGTLR